MFNVLLFSGISDLSWERFTPGPAVKKISPGIATGLCVALFITVFTNLCTESKAIAEIGSPAGDSRRQAKKKNDPMKVTVIFLAAATIGALVAFYRQSLTEFAIFSAHEASKWLKGTSGSKAKAPALDVKEQ